MQPSGTHEDENFYFSPDPATPVPFAKDSTPNSTNNALLGTSITVSSLSFPPIDESSQIISLPRNQPESEIEIADSDPTDPKNEPDEYSDQLSKLMDTPKTIPHPTRKSSLLSSSLQKESRFLKERSSLTPPVDLEVNDATTDMKSSTAPIQPDANHDSSFATTPPLIAKTLSNPSKSPKIITGSSPFRLQSTTPPSLPGLLPFPTKRSSNINISSSLTADVLGRSVPRSIPQGQSITNRSMNYGTIPKQPDFFGTPGRSALVDVGSYKRSMSPPNGRYEGDSESLVSEDEAVRIVSEHLFQPETEPIVGSVSHSLLGGDVTHGIYQWQEKRTQQRRRNSVPDLRRIQRTQSTVLASDLRAPGAFRRHYIRSQVHDAQEYERLHNTAPFLTNSFIDFLLLYGYYGGDVVPSDEEEEDYGVEQGYDESTPFIQSSRPPSISPIHGTSAKKAFFMLMKAFVGTGVLFLPKAFANGGMLFSIGLMIGLGYLTLHCMLLLVETSRKLGGSFGDIGEHYYGHRMRQLILASIAISQMGFCCAYYIFVAQNLRDLTMILSGCRLILPEWVFFVLQLSIYAPLSWIRKIKHFSWTSLVADVFILLGLSYLFYYNVSVLSTRGVAKDMVLFNPTSFPLFVGTAMFAFEGICLILPIADSMAKPEKFGAVLSLCVLTIGVIFIATGVLGYATFGSTVSTIVFLDLPSNPPSPAVITLQLFYAMAIMLSFPLCVYPAIRITEQAIFGFQDGKLNQVVKWQKNLYRVGLVSSLAAIAFFGSNNLDKFVSLVGCFACIPLSFIYPSLFHYHLTENRWVKIKDLFLVAIGVVAMVYTTWITLRQWVLEEPDIPRNRCESPVPVPPGLLEHVSGKLW